MNEYFNVRDYYVDQISGMIVDMSENIIDYYGDRNGGKLADAHLFAGKMSNAPRRRSTA